MNSKHQLTKEGYDKIYSRLQFLKDTERPRIVEALKEARAQGDLSENAEYDAARDEQASIEKEINELEEIIKNAVIIDDTGHSSNIGKEITVRYKDDEKLDTFVLVSSSLESDPLNDKVAKISKECPLGKAVLEATVGAIVPVKSESGYEFYIEVVSIKQASK